MSNNRKKQKKQYTAEELYNPQIDLSRDAYLYGRQSQRDQVIKNIQSHLAQTVKLLEYTKDVLGFKDDGSTGKVTLFVENEVVDADGNIKLKDASGTWSIDRRPGLKTICDAIEHGTEDKRKVGIVVAEFVDRLFRDEDRIDSNVFIKICKENDCFVHIESKRMTYNFANAQHAELFRMEVQMAAAYIENHIRGTMLRRRNQAALSGKWAGLGAIPVGFIVDKDEASPSYGKFIPYHPHAEIGDGLFDQFIELGFDIDALCRELEKKPYIFPLFEPWVDKCATTRCGLRLAPNGEGYMISRRGLLYFLCNEVNIGTFRRGGIVIENNHEGIVDKAKFWMVYDRLKTVRPDGSPTGKLAIVRYTHHADRQERLPLLKPLTTADGSVYFANTKAGTDSYGYYNVSVHRGLKRYNLMSLRADDLEGVIIARMFWHLRQVNIGDIKQIRARKLEEKRKRVVEIERTLQVIGEEIAALEVNMTQVTIISVVKQLEEKMARLLAQREDLIGQRASIVQSYQDVPVSTLEEELQDLEELWPEKSFTHRKALVELLVKKVVIHYVTPRFCNILVEWSYSEWGTEERLLDRRLAGGREWSEQEKQVLTMMYEYGDQIAIMRALPNRTWGAICDTAVRSLGLRRQGRKTEVIHDHSISMDDLQFLEQNGLTLDDLAICNSNVWS